MRVGYIGVGNIGRPMAAQILAAGHSLAVHDLVEDAAAELIEEGASWKESPAAVAAVSDVVFTCLPGPPEMENVVFGTSGIAEGISPGALYVDSTTNSPDLVRRTHATLAERGIDMLDAPVSGGIEGARTRDLTMLVGGSDDVFARVKPLLDAVAKTVMHVGGIGAGSICKITHNAAAFGRSLAMIECLTLGVKAGVDVDILLEVFRKSAFGTNFDLHHRLPATLFRGDFEPRFELRTARKDINLAKELAREYDVPMAVVELCDKDMALAAERGLDLRDSSVYLKMQEERAGVEIRVAN